MKALHLYVNIQVERGQITAVRSVRHGLISPPCLPGQASAFRYSKQKPQLKRPVAKITSFVKGFLRVAANANPSLCAGASEEAV